MRNVKLCISTEMDENCPKRTVDGKYDESGDRITYVWSQSVEGEKNPVTYRVTADRKAHTARMTRTGSISMELNFDSSKTVDGSLNTSFGVIPLEVKTEYMNFPSVLSNNFEICYAVCQGGIEALKNIISINLLLQNE